MRRHRHRVFLRHALHCERTVGRRKGLQAALPGRRGRRAQAGPATDHAPADEARGRFATRWEGRRNLDQDRVRPLLGARGETVPALLHELSVRGRQRPMGRRRDRGRHGHLERRHPLGASEARTGCVARLEAEQPVLRRRPEVALGRQPFHGNPLHPARPPTRRAVTRVSWGPSDAGRSSAPTGSTGRRSTRRPSAAATRPR